MSNTKLISVLVYMLNNVNFFSEDGYLASKNVIFGETT